MSEPEQGKRRGRPPKYAGEGKRQNFSFRIRDKVRERLAALAKESGRSLSEEIEWRIERSLEWEEAFGTAREMLANHKAKMKEIEGGNLEAEMRRQGWTPEHGSQGRWLKPGMVQGPRSGFVDPAELEPEHPALEVRVERIEQALEGAGLLKSETEPSP